MAHELILAFDTDSSEFVRGIEIGKLWERLQGSEEVAMTLHAANAEMVMRVSEALDRPVTGEIIDEHWLTAVFAAA